jgi:hypothetical protein
MKVLTCAAARRRLHAFHDDELPVADQIAVSTHLEWCEGCAAAFDELGALRAALRERSHRLTLSAEEAVSLQSRIVSRAKVERRFTLTTQLHEIFDDMHMVYAGAGAALAAAVCAVIMLAMMRFATVEQPGSFGELVRLLASSRSPVDINDRVRRPRALEQPFSAPARGPSGDTFVMLAGVVTREGRITNLELVNAIASQGQASGDGGAEAVNELMGAISKARFEPASMDGQPVPVNMVWLQLITHTTVRGTIAAAPLEARARPVAKKRAEAVVPPASNGLVGV